MQVIFGFLSQWFCAQYGTLVARVNRRRKVIPFGNFNSVHLSCFTCIYTRYFYYRHSSLIAEQLSMLTWKVKFTWFLGSP